MPDETKPNGTPPESPQSADKPAAEPAKTPSPSPVSPATETKPVPPAAAKPAAPAAAGAPPRPAVPPKPAGPTPVPWETELTTQLKKVYGSGIKEASTYLGQNYLVVDSSILAEILLMMRDDEKFDYCVDITAVHYPKREKAEFDVVYILYSFAKNTRVRVKTQVADGQSVPSAVPIWPTTNWLEREAFDMFGIQFEGHPDLKRILMPDGWKGHPLRKDYNILQQDTDWVHINLGIESAQ
ncbi:MAG TPA: NADH-quinone oxidoreductase subunit C [Terriglobales bacterium]|nr:NADH-quinone oxidoreductase subunit C [Terriglobales bacterium]